MIKRGPDRRTVAMAPDQAALSPDDLPGALFFFEGDQLRGLNSAARRLMRAGEETSLQAILQALDPGHLLRERLRVPAGDGPQTALRVAGNDIAGRPLCVDIHLAPPEPDSARRLGLAYDCSLWLEMEEQLQRRLVFERLMTEASASLIRSAAEDLDAVIVDVLGTVGEFFGVDRAYVFLSDAAAQTQSNTHEWVATGISREAHNLQDVPVDTFPWLMSQLRADRIFQLARISDLPPEAVNEYAEFEREGIQSILIVPLWHGTVLEGFVGFDSVRRQVDWGGHYVIGLRLMTQMLASVLEARTLTRRLQAQAFHDALTGLPNRKLLADRFAQAHKRLHRDGGNLVVAVVDVDDFKHVNDSHGHPAGDALLCEIGRRLRDAVRDMDTVARMGGDEFAVVAHGNGDMAAAELGQRLLAAADGPAELDGTEVAFGLSIGLVCVSTSECSFESLLQAADAAMYEAKAQGKNRWAEAGEAACPASRGERA